MASNPIKEALTRIEEETQGQEISSVEELALDSIHFQKFAPELTSEIEKYTELLFLSLNDCALTSLAGFPKLQKLIRLELTDNKINAAALSNLSQLTELQSLSLGGNPISSFEDLQAFTKLSKLIQLDLFGCPMSEDPKYRERIFSLFPSLQILDNRDKEGVEVDYEEEDEDNDDLEDVAEGAEGVEEDVEDEHEPEGGSDDDQDDDDDDDDGSDDDDDDDIEKKATKNKKVKRN